MHCNNLCMGCMKEKGNAEHCPHCDWVEKTLPESTLHLIPRILLQEKYIIGRVLGQGGFGITYLAWDSLLDRKLAVKEYFPRELATRSGSDNTVRVHSSAYGEQYSYGLSKFLDEAKTLASFDNHPNIISVKDFFKANGTAYLVMNYLEGCTLKDYLVQKGMALTFDEALAVILPVLDALETVHESGVLHRDISPDNIFITAQGGVILLDFGAARHALGEKGKNLSIILKPGYAPEEQYRSKGVQGPWTDIYAVAATFYHAITGTMPQESLDRLAVDQLVPPSMLGVAINPSAEKALLKALAVNADHRFRSVKEFRSAIWVIDAVEFFDPEEIKAIVQNNEAVLVNRLAQPFPAETSLSEQPASVINIGRHESNDLVLSDEGASRFHAAVYRQNGRWYLLDRDSTCGTYLNDRRVEGVSPLPSGSKIVISETNLYFSGKALVTDSGLEIYATSNDVVLYRDGNSFDPRQSYTQGSQQHETGDKKAFPVYLGLAAIAIVVLIGVLLFSVMDSKSSTPAEVDTPVSVANPDDIVPRNIADQDVYTQDSISYAGGQYTGDLKNGKPHGQGTWIYKTTSSQSLSYSATGSLGDQIYEGEWQDGKKHGKGRMTLPTGVIQSGFWENDNYIGQKTE